MSGNSNITAAKTGILLQLGQSDASESRDAIRAKLDLFMGLVAPEDALQLLNAVADDLSSQNGQLKLATMAIDLIGEKFSLDVSQLKSELMGPSTADVIGGQGLTYDLSEPMSGVLSTGDAPRNNRPGQKRKSLSDDDLNKLKELPNHLDSIAKVDPKSEWGDKLADENIINLFKSQYEAITDVKPVYARDLVSLIRDHGDELIKMHERPIPIGVVSYSAKDCDEKSMKAFIRTMFGVLKDEGMLDDVALVGGYTNAGGIKASYAAADAYPEVEKQGIMAPPGVFWETAHVDKGLIFGESKWGVESPIFLDLINDGFMVGFGGGGQGLEEAQWFIEKNGQRTVIAEGFTHKKNGKEIPGSVDSTEGGFRIPKAAADPIAAGKAAGKHIAKMVRARRAEQKQSPLLKLAMEASPKQILEVDQWAKSNTSKYRIIRILNAVSNKLSDKGLPQADITAALADLSFKFVEYTFGIDNFEENALWQKRAKDAIRAVGEPLTDLIDAVAVDVMFASWFGIQEYQKEPSFFEVTTGSMPKPVTKVELDSQHTLNAEQYAEIRLDLKTVAYLKAQDSEPEVFLGTKDELEAFYRAKGYQFSKTIHDSNGTFFYLMTHGDTQKIVMHGVDSEARLSQLSALMTASDIDTSRVLVRGSMDRVRGANRSMLELALANMDMPIAGVIIGNKGDAVQALAEQAGVSPKDIKVESKTIGPFRFQAARVKAHGHAEEQVILAFSPAYGELSEDLVDACLTAGAQNFMIGGAGGSLKEHDVLGVVHRVTEVDYDGEIIDLKTDKNVNLLDVAGATDTRNFYSRTPLEQTHEWADRTRKSGSHNVDQETGPIFRALQRAAASGVKVNLKSGLYQSDVVGTGALNSGTVGNQYGDAIGALAKSFYEQLGISSVTSKDAQDVVIDGSTRGLLAEQKIRKVNLDGVDIPLPDLETIGDSTWLSSTQQFKGQKRVLRISSDMMGSKERTMLRKLLQDLNASQFWVVADQRDKNHGEIIEIAKESGFESILVSTTQAVIDEAVNGQPTFIIKEANESDIDTTLNEFIRDGKNDDYEVNTAQHYLFHLGTKQPEATTHGHMYSSLLDVEDIEDLADDIRREARQATRSISKDIRKHFEAQGIDGVGFHLADELGDVFGKRQPIVFSGASKKSAPQIAPEYQLYMKIMLRMLARNGDKEKIHVVTGGTNYGFEKWVHEEFGQAGYKILGTITENTGADEVSSEIQDFVFTGINWFGMARPVNREILEAYNGQQITAGGGGILRDMIQLSLKMNLRVHNMNGPMGASTDAAEDYAAHAFSSVHQLFERMGLKVDMLVDLPELGQQEVRWWTKEQIEWALPKSLKALDASDNLSREFEAACEALNNNRLSSYADFSSFQDAYFSRFNGADVLQSTALSKEYDGLMRQLQETFDQRKSGAGRSAEERAKLMTELQSIYDSI